MLLGYDVQLIGTVSGVLFLVAVGYNLLLSWLEREGYAEGYECILAAGAVLLTLCAVALVNVQACVLALWFFCFSGLPLALGSMWRYVRKRKRGQEQVRRDAQG